MPSRARTVYIIGLTEGDQTTVEIIKELREVLNGKYISVLSREEVRDLLDYLCAG